MLESCDDDRAANLSILACLSHARDGEFLKFIDNDANRRIATFLNFGPRFVVNQSLKNADTFGIGNREISERLGSFFAGVLPHFDSIACKAVARGQKQFLRHLAAKPSDFSGASFEPLPRNLARLRWVVVV